MGDLRKDNSNLTDFQKYVQAELEKFMRGKGDLEITNYIAYSLETINYTVGCTLMIVYLVVSKAGIRFHVQLRLLLLMLITGLFGTAMSRLILMPIRFIFAHDLKLDWLKTLEGYLQLLGFFAVMMVETSTFAIAVERLVAAGYVRTYEKMFTSWKWILCTFFIMIVSNAILDYFLFCFKGDVYGLKPDDPPLLSMDNIAEIVMGANVIGVIFLLIAWWYSKRSLTERERGLSQSFQGKENLQVINIILPISIMLFISRTVQLITSTLAYNPIFGFNIFNALGLRINLHLYNQSLAICVFATAFILIYLQPAIRESLGKHLRKKSSVADQILVRRQQDVIETNNYFAELKSSWAVR